MTKSEKKKFCAGCDDNFYNSGNPYGVKECWHFKNARVVKRKEVHINDMPPWKRQRVFKTLNCYHRARYVYVDPKREY